MKKLFTLKPKLNTCSATHQSPPELTLAAGEALEDQCEAVHHEAVVAVTTAHAHIRLK
jgi:hypothetical protein